MILSRFSFELTRRSLHVVLGIETSCDDTAVAIVDSKRRILASRRFADRDSQARLGGICPSVVALQHRSLLPSLISECLSFSRIRPADLDAVAVSTRPGLVIALKEGMLAALNLSSLNRVPLIPIHHMRAHALVSSLIHANLQYPFVALLVSGGHSLIALVKSCDDFELIADSVSGSAGECLDKIGRQLQFGASGMHPGAALEQAATRASSGSHLSLDTAGVSSVGGANFNFSALKSSLLSKLRKEGDKLDKERFAALTQHLVARHLCTKLHAALEYLIDDGSIDSGTAVVMAGGVAANRYLHECVSKVCHLHSLYLLRIPQSLCTDNAEMIAWNGIKSIEEGSPSIIQWTDLPSSIYVEARSIIGKDRRSEVPSKPKIMLKASSIHAGSDPLIVHSKEEYRLQGRSQHANIDP